MISRALGPAVLVTILLFMLAQAVRAESAIDKVIYNLSVWIAAHSDYEYVAPPDLEYRTQQGLKDLYGVDVGHIYGLYHKGVIYMPEGWDGSEPAQQSNLLHELVHHSQFTHGRQFACWQLAEKEAYEFQALWLKQQGLDMWTVLGLNPMFHRVYTSCGRE